MKKLLFTLTLLLMAFMVHAGTVIINGIYYDLSEYTRTAEVSSGCQYSGAIYIPNKVTSSGLTYKVTGIKWGAFSYCPNLTFVSIPTSVTSIGSGAFSYCYGLKSITIPNSVTDIERNAFEGCTGFTSITIPNSVKNMGDGLFKNCYNITSITISNSVKTIGSYTFERCSNLTSINIPTSVTSIGNNAFDGCSSLTSVTIPNSVTSIGDWAFDGCSSLTSVIIPNNVTNIGGHAFRQCSNLTSITIPNSVTTIGNYAFYQCTSLTSITIPSSVSSVFSSTFSGCSNLTTIKVDVNNPKYDSRNNCNAIIETATNTLVSGCKNTTIPTSVTNIGNYAFSNCSGLTSITIPFNVSNIGYGAFQICPNLTSVTVENPVPVTIEQYTFSNRANATLYVPIGSKSAYLAADYWKEFKEIIEKNMSHDAELGDVNGDGEISISDVTLLVDYLLEQAGDNFILANADVNKDGRISVSDAVSIIKLILEGDPEPQAYLTCPDGNHPHMIDLGLPSGTKWACCNVGADKPEAYGGYYAWGVYRGDGEFDTHIYKAGKRMSKAVMI